MVPTSPTTPFGFGSDHRGRDVCSSSSPSARAFQNRSRRIGRCGTCVLVPEAIRLRHGSIRNVDLQFYMLSIHVRCFFFSFLPRFHPTVQGSSPNTLLSTVFPVLGNFSSSEPFRFGSEFSTGSPPAIRTIDRFIGGTKPSTSGADDFLLYGIR